MIGSLRIIVHRIVGYWEHPTEYGLHWNFYMTIAVTNLATTLVKDAKYAVSMSIALITIYEIILDNTGLKEFIFYAPRGTIFSANREGIFSTIGYLSLQLIGIGIGRI